MFDSQSDAIRSQLPIQLDFDPTAVTALALTEDARHCIVGNRSSIVRMYRIPNSEVVWESEKFEQDITGVAVSKDGKNVAVSTGVLGQTNASGRKCYVMLNSGLVTLPLGCGFSYRNLVWHDL